MTPNMLTAFWWAWALYFGLMTVYLALLWDAGRPSLTLALGAALLAGALGTGIAARFGRLRALWRQRRQKVLDLNHPLELQSWTHLYERFQLSPKLWMEPRRGRLWLGDDHSSRQAQEHTGDLCLQLLLEEAPKGSHQPMHLKLWVGKPERGELLYATSSPLRIHAACLPALYWAAWRLCEEKQWALSAPFGAVSPQELARPLRQRLERQQHWAQDAMRELEGEVPFLQEETDTLVIYRFPLHEASPTVAAALHHWTVGQDRWLRHLAIWSALGLLTAPLTAAALWLRARLTDHRELELRLQGGQIWLDGAPEALGDVLHISLLPVHPGAPVLLTRERAVLLGGLASYEDRVRCGRHLLERMLRELPQEEAAPPARAARRRTRPSGASAFLSRRWSWEPPQEPASQNHQLLSAMAVAASLLGLGVAWQGWRPWSSAVRVFYDAPWWRLPDSVVWVGLGACTLGAALAWRRLARRQPGMALASPLIAASAVLSAAVLGTLGPYDRDEVRWQDLSGIDASGRDLSNLNLEALTLHQANFQGAILRNANFSHAHLWEANFNGADLRDATLPHAWLEHADLRGADLRGANLQEARLSSAQLYRTDLRGAWLVNAQCFNSELIEVDLSGADLTGINLNNSDLTRVKLKRASLLLASLRGAQLHHCDLTGARFQGKSGNRASIDQLIIGLDTKCVDGVADYNKSEQDCLGIKPPE